MVELYPHQIKAVEEMADGKVLTGGVGTGKTITSLVYFYTKVMEGTVGDYDVPYPMDLYVFTTARKRDEQDWQREAAKMGISIYRDDSATGIELVVDSYNNMAKYKEVKNAFIILDEQRMVGSGAWTKTFLKLAKSNRWIMLSATPGDKWEDYIPLFVANGFYKNRTEFKREHCVYSYYGRYPKLERYLSEGKLIRYRNQILVEMPYLRHTTRHIHQTAVDHDRSLFDRVVKKRWNPYEERPLRDAAELFSVMRKVVNSDSSRMTQLRSLMQTHPRLIVFYNFDYELTALRSLASGVTSSDSTQTSGKSETLSTSTTILETEESKLWSSDSSRATSSAATGPIGGGRPPEELISVNDSASTMSSEKTISSGTKAGDTSFAVAEWNGHKHEPVPDTDSWVYLVQYTAGSEAWNCTATDAICFYSMNYSYRLFEQAQGRIDRLDTKYKDLHYYVLTSKSTIDRAIMKSLKVKKNFNEKEYVGSFG